MSSPRSEASLPADGSPPGDDGPEFDVVIIGGGITGLSTAFFLRQSNPALRVRVLEASATPGGKIAGAEVAGIAVDTGPDAFLARVFGGVELAAALGLADELVAPATGQAYVWSRGKLRALPAGLVLGVPTKLVPLARSGILSARGIARAALDELLPRRVNTADPSVSEAIGSHLGREVVERLVDPLLGGINASNCDVLSLASAAPNLATAASSPRLMRSLRQANAVGGRGQIGVNEDRPVFLAPRSGIRTLVAKLSEQVSPAVNCPVHTVTRTPQGWLVATPTNLLSTRTIVFATPASVTSQLLSTVAPDASKELAGIRTASVALSLLAYPSGSVALPPGSGMLVPRPENRLLTASSWWNQKWPHLDTRGHVLVRASAGRDGDTRFMDLDDDALVDVLHQDLADALGIRSRPVDARVTRWVNGFPQYDTGHTARVDRLEHALAREASGVTLAGASYRGIGIPACIRDAKRAADETLRVLHNGRTART